MPNTDWASPGTVDNLPNINGISWTTPDNVKDAEGSPITTAGFTGAKHDGNDPGIGATLHTTSYGFLIPTNAIITGIEAKIFGGSSGLPVGELAYLVEELGSPVVVLGTHKTDDWADMPIELPDETHIYGSSSDRWGAPLTPTIVNQPSFGWAFMIFNDIAPLSCHIGYMQLRVHYRYPDPIVITAIT